MTTRKINVAVTIMLQVAFDPEQSSDYQAINAAEAHVYETMRDAPSEIDNRRITYSGVRDVVGSETISRGNGASIVTVRPMAFDEVLDNYNHNRAVTDNEWQEHYKEYSHLMRMNTYSMRELPWVGRAEMTKMWASIVQQEREERDVRFNRIVRNRVLRYLDGAFEDGIEEPTPDNLGVEPF